MLELRLMKRLNHPIFLSVFAVLILVFVATVAFFFMPDKDLTLSNNNITTKGLFSDILQSTPTPAVNLLTPPMQKILPTDYHVFQSFNNCGPASLSMALRFYGIEKSQTELGQALRPYQIAGGDNDDKSVTLEELAKEAEKYGFIPYHRPNGDIEKVKLFITYDMPVITRTWLKPDDDIGHYRVIKGYDETTGEFIQDDSLQNKNLRYTYAEFNQIWEKFNYEYLVLVPSDKKEIADMILGVEKDAKIAWQNAVENAKKELQSNPNNTTTRFNLSVAYSNTGEYQKSVQEYELVENQLSFRTLWYQIEPIEAYYELGNYDKVFEITDKILNNQNRAFSELYVIRGNIYKQKGQTDLARSEYQKAVFYNSNLEKAQNALNSL